ncbi:hypothetical protein H0H92_002560 [Tricholoma furcatifolium]|nr:hypothetical protein H0H92_002560 [Tricholoma furcatifolium]
MSSSQTYSLDENTTASNVSLMLPEVGASSSSESVDLVHAPLTAEQQIEAREKALRDRALKRIKLLERNHQLAEEECQVVRNGRYSSFCDAVWRSRALTISCQGDELFNKNDFAGASARYIDATNHWSSNPEFYLKLTKAYIKCELYADAAHAATRALSFDPKSLEARYTRGVARLEQGLLAAAKIDFETVIAHDPVHALAHTSLGRTLSLLQATKIGNHVLSPPPIETTPDGDPVDFSFPRYEDDKLELAEPSDTSDCNHVGNGVPCRFYNHDGCARGVACDFSHAPDEKSVRDDFGRNVCLYYLLSSCKFGEHKCVYLHSKDALPTTYGWWNDSEQIDRVKSVMELAEKKAKEQRSLELHLYRQEAKKARAKSQARGKSRGVSSKAKSKERGGMGKQQVKDGETADTDSSAAKDEITATEHTGAESTPSTAVAEGLKDISASEVVAVEDSTTLNVEPKPVEAEKSGGIIADPADSEPTSVAGNSSPPVKLSSGDRENGELAAAALADTDATEDGTSRQVEERERDSEVKVTPAAPNGELSSVSQEIKENVGEPVNVEATTAADVGQQSTPVLKGDALMTDQVSTYH